VNATNRQSLFGNWKNIGSGLVFEANRFIIAMNFGDVFPLGGIALWQSSRG
jgi:hypothetical protein